ncbi:hypothetical protein SAMN05892883_3412 [Jatrophihabitans sp. GAS493]|uniref:DUF6325 family protein n=1 Tax=Jatrophihabitans sp. GAS493 TaxID=1907575 RepID=UPI000BB89B73|nr:DUF6325 family protein [Jatrophihabitans sp. GAS493]SOD74230.1 hypothetical protein SAMN05892883_3412 [Jatrophihabitans sp. GAS493]
MVTKLGPIEVIVVSFPDSDFNGSIITEIQSLVDRNIINVVDGLLAKKDLDGSIELIEFEQTNLESDAAALAALVGEIHPDLISDEDVDELAAALEPGASAAILVFEHEWAKPLRNSIVDSGGVLVANLRIPGLVVDEVLTALDELSEIS